MIISLAEVISFNSGAKKVISTIKVLLELLLISISFISFT